MIKIDQNMTQLRKQQADLTLKMTELQGNLEALNSQLESSQGRMTSLSQKLDDLQADLARRLNVLTGQVTGAGTSPGPATPGDLLKLAQNDFHAGKFELARVGFRNVLTQYPKSDAAAEAQFYLGETEFARKNYVDAAREYEKCSSLHPKSEFAPRALYKRAVTLQMANQKSAADEAFRFLIKQYPQHELSRSAKEQLKL